MAFSSGGVIQGYQKETRGDSQLNRSQAIAVVSHLIAQRRALQDLLSRGRVRHIIVTRTYDDTNVTVSPHVRVSKKSQDETKPGQDHMNAVGKLGQRKVSALLGIVQRISVRDSASALMHTAQLHCPSQVLPKVGRANGRMVWDIFFEFRSI